MRNPPSKIINPTESNAKTTKKSNSLGIVASLAILLGGGFFSYKNNFFGLIGGDSKVASVREIASVEKKREIKRVDDIVFKISLDNFDKFSQKAFLNNEMD